MPKEIGGHSSAVFPPDIEHMRDVLGRHQPQAVIAFGAVARRACATIWTGHFMACCHPAARFQDAITQLSEVAVRCRELLRSPTRAS
jgi:hypothetical protein